SDSLSIVSIVLEESRNMARDPKIISAVEELMQFPGRYKELTEGLANAMESQKQILLRRAEQHRARASDALELMSLGADQRAAAQINTVVAETTRAAWFNMLAGIVVVVALLAVTVLSAFTVARPIRRIADVLARIAGGQMLETIPYQNRQDEIGETARAA